MLKGRVLAKSNFLDKYRITLNDSTELSFYYKDINIAAIKFEKRVEKTFTKVVRRKYEEIIS